MAWIGGERQGPEWRGSARPRMARLCKAMRGWRGGDWLGTAGVVGIGKARHGRNGNVGLGVDGRSNARTSTPERQSGKTLGGGTDRNFDDLTAAQAA